MTKEEIVAMAVAVLAEELGTEIKRVQICSFTEIEKSSLEKYIEDRALQYKKYQLGDEI